MAEYEIRKKQLIKPDLKKLIKCITNFQEDEPEFKQCENYAISQILHHTYLSVNRHQVQRSINGLINKFHVHGFTDKSKQLEELVNKFVTSEAFKNHEETDVQWSILLLLINLSDNPTSMVLQEDLNPLPSLLPPKADNSLPKEDHLNWTEYLKEGWEKFQLPTDECESIEWSDLESEDEISLIYQKKEESDKVQPVMEEKRRYSVESLSKRQKDFETGRDIRLRLCEEKILSENWLKQNIQYDWWNSSSVRMDPKSNHPSARFAILWEEHENKHTQGMIPLGSTMLISEYKVIREVLWILQVPNESTFLFNVASDGRIVPKENISIPSLTPVSLASYLRINVCCYSEMVSDLMGFIDAVADTEFEIKKPPYTYQSYAKTLHELLNNLFCEISKIESNVIKQDTTITLVSVIEDLHPSLIKLQYMHCIHKAAICHNWLRSEGWFSSVRLLATLYEEVYVGWKDEFVSISMELFIKTFRVYLQIIDIWLSEGKIEDWRDEFIVKRIDGILKVVAYEKVLQEIKKTRLTEILKVIEKAGSDLEYIRQLDEISTLATKVENKGCLYKEFLDFLNSDFSKTTEIKLDEVDSLVNVAEKKSVNSNCNLENHKTESTIKVKSVPMFSSINMSPGYLDTALHNLTTKSLLSSPWLSLSFSMYMQPEKNNPTNLQKKNEYRDVVGDVCSTNIGTLPLHHIIEKNVIHLVSQRQRIASKIMVETLLTKCNLQQHLSMLGNVFVLEASYIVQRFYTMLFNSVRPTNVERLEYSMNIVLEECVEFLASQEVASSIQFSVHYTDDPVSLSYNIIDFVNIDYKVYLPLSLIITEESLLIYNNVFKFLLKIEWALAVLHKLRFSDLKETPANRLLIRLLYKLRLFLMHCVTTLQSYFVAFTPKQLRSLIEKNLLNAKNMDDIINAHNSYLKMLKTHCLLDSSGTIVKKAVEKLLHLCGVLSNYWKNQTETSLTMDSLNALEEQYTKAHVGLHIVLKHFVGQHSNSSLKFLSADIERCLPVSLMHLNEQDGSTNLY